VSNAGKGKGAMFTIELPTAPATLAPSLPDGKKIDPVIESLRILLVEYDENAAQTIARLLRRAGHEVETADSISRAKRLFDQHEFDLLISDVGLPDGSGFELMRQLKAERFIDGIALTDNGIQSNGEAMRAAGFREHLAKPVNWSQLEAAIRETTSRLQPT
jgi:DNA-binding response OmpR family regulator